MVRLIVGLVVLVLLLVGLGTFVFIRQRKNCSCNTKREEESTDENPVYATYEVHYDPVAEVGIICCAVESKAKCEDELIKLVFQVQDQNPDYGVVYEGEGWSKTIDANPDYD